jgi:hypothetical protein
VSAICPICGLPLGDYTRPFEHVAMHLAAKPAAGPWIAVTERTPGDGQRVLVWGPGIGERIAENYTNEGWIERGGGRLIRTVTHWAEITPPKGTE